MKTDLENNQEKFKTGITVIRDACNHTGYQPRAEICSTGFCFS